MYQPPPTDPSSRSPTQYGPQPGPPPPPMAQPPKKRRTWLWVVLGVLALLILGCVGVVAIATQGAQTSTPRASTNAPVTGSTPAAGNTPTATIAPTATPTMEATAMPTPTPTHPAKFPATHGRPHIGGPFSDFVGKYGQPIGQGSGNSYNFQSDTTRPDGSLPPGPNVTPNAAGMVIGLDIVSDSTTTVSFAQARLHCEPWLPSDAVEFNSAPPYIDYHSSVGEIVMMVNDFGDCVLNIGKP